MKQKARAVVTLWGLKGETGLAMTTFADKEPEYPCLYPTRAIALLGRREGQKVVRVRITAEEV